MFSSSVKEEVQEIERLSRPELLDRLRQLQVVPRAWLPRPWVKGGSVEDLRLLLLAALLFRALRRPDRNG